MSLPKSFRIIPVLLISLFLINASAVLAEIRSGENCGMQSTQGTASQLDQISCKINPESCLHQTAWYQDRDNSMIPVPIEEGVGAAMAIFMTLNGYSQGVQVCPGVYLATAHGVLDDPSKARSEGGAVRSPLENSVRVIGYPMDPDNMMRARGSEAQFVSPRLRDPSTWSDPTTDYVFITVDSPIRPTSFVRPVRASNQRLVEASNSGEINVHLYRPQTRFNTDENGTPDFNNDTWANEVSEIVPLYQAPMRVNEACRTVPAYSGLIGSNCPTEQAVSGSSYVSNINGQDYMVGLHIEGSAVSEASFEDTPLPNTYVPSSHFCEDYELVCGQPCAELDEVLPPFKL
jgi:hypothetical protein